MKRLFLTLVLFACVSAANAAIVTRYFSTTAAGSGDGTTWANRAALFTTGAWDDIIDTFDFAGSDSLLCYIGPGTYTCSESLATAICTPTAANPLMLHGCDSSGNPLTPSNPDWLSAQPVDWDSALPVIDCSSNISTVNLAFCYLRLLKFTTSARPSNFLLAHGIDWCVAINSTANTSSGVLSMTQPVSNSYLQCSGSSYNAVATINGITSFWNVRIVGNESASSGNRYGLASNPVSTRPLAQGLTVVSNVVGIAVATASAVGNLAIDNCTISDCTTGILLSGTASQTQNYTITGTYIANCTTNIHANESFVFVSDNRLRGGTENLYNLKNIPATWGNDSAAGSDAEFADYATGDFRIAADSAKWGKGYGAGDEIPTAAQIAAAVWAREGRSLTE